MLMKISTQKKTEVSGIGTLCKAGMLHNKLNLKLF